MPVFSNSSTSFRKTISCPNHCACLLATEETWLKKYPRTFGWPIFMEMGDFVEVHQRSSGISNDNGHTAFRTFDLDCDGKISAEEVMEMLRRLWENCSLEECKKMVRAVDTDGDGMVDMDEFMNHDHEARVKETFHFSLDLTDSFLDIKRHLL
ncbi:hypothetical protein V6N13_106097 [Hibiscus sabdariffa]|uniref:EF-hand domain-containing protein n=1 Tax=Hibiscus sabdariffa TaxID=183260 RepID=A0ABR2EZM8_9ROSI